MPNLECASSPQVLTDLETCQRKGLWASSWASNRLPAKEMVNLALRQALTATELNGDALGEVAGAAVMQFAEDRGIQSDQDEVYSEVIHHAALSDVLVTAIRKPKDEPWITPTPVQCWTPDCLMSPDGKYLRRIAIVSHWNDQRHYSECRSWYAAGEIAHYELPMQLVVLVIGQERLGKRQSPWVSGFLHPMNHTLRFRKKQRGTSEVFNDKWEKIWREDHAEITRETWLNSMLKDDVLPQVCFRVTIPVPEKIHCQRIRDIAARKMENLGKVKETPEPNLSSCDWPVPCLFRRLCHTIPERGPSRNNGFIRIGNSIRPTSGIPVMSLTTAP